MEDNARSIPLFHAYGSVKCAALLINARPADVNAIDSDGCTALHIVGHYGTLDVFRLLLDAGSVMEKMDHAGRTPLYWAFCEDRRKIAELLLDRGAQLEGVKLDGLLNSIPEWAISFALRRAACRLSSRAVLQLARRCSRVIGGNGKDVLRLISRLIWGSRRCNKLWGNMK